MKLDLKQAPPLLVYNMLQDMRHIVICDFRKDQNHIRNSIKVDKDNYRQAIVKQFMIKTKPVYEGDDMKRVLFVIDNQPELLSVLRE